MAFFDDLFGGGGDTPAPPKLVQPQVFNYQEAVNKTPGMLAGVNQQFLDQYFNQSGQLGAAQYSNAAKYNPLYAQEYAKNYQTLLPQLVQTRTDAMRQSNPTAYGIDQALGNQVMEGVRAGGGLTDTEKFLAQQDIRSGQSRLGASQQGISDLFDEARFLGQTRFGREQARQGAAENYLRSSPFLQIGANQAVPGPMAPGMAGNLMQFSPSDIMQGQLAQNQSINQKRAAFNQQQMDLYNNRPESQGDLAGFLGLGAGLLGTAAGAYMGNPGAVSDLLGGLGYGGNGGNIPSFNTLQFAAPQGTRFWSDNQFNWK